MPSSFGEIYKLGGDHLPTSTITLKESGNKPVVSAYHFFNLIILQGVWSQGWEFYSLWRPKGGEIDI